LPRKVARNGLRRRRAFRHPSEGIPGGGEAMLDHSQRSIKESQQLLLLIHKLHKKPPAG